MARRGGARIGGTPHEDCGLSAAASARRPCSARRTAPARGSGTPTPAAEKCSQARSGLFEWPRRPVTPSKSGRQDERPLASGEAGDQAVEHDLGRDRLLARRGVAVVDDDERDPARLADPGEHRDVGLPAALDDGDLRAVGVVAERREDGREHELLRPPLDEDRGAGEEELAPLGVELAHHPKRLVRVERLRLHDMGAAAGAVADEDELLQPRDVQEGRGVRRVEHLVPGAGEGAQTAVEVALRVRAEEELGLLDEEHRAGDLPLAAGVDPGHERRGPGGVRPALGRVAKRPPEAADCLLGRVGVAVDLEQRPGAPHSREKEHGRCTAAPDARLVGRMRGKPDPASVAEPRLDRELVGAATEVLPARRRRRRVEEGPDSTEEVGLAGAGLADERGDRAELELDVPRRAVVADPDRLQERHGSTLTGGASGYGAVRAGRGSGSGVRTFSRRSRRGS